MTTLLTFDLDNTLWDTDSVIMAAERACFAWLEQYVPAVTQLYTLPKLFDYKRQLLQSFPDWHFQLTKLRYETYRRVILQGGYPSAKADEMTQQLMVVFHDYRNRVVLYPNTREILEKLAQQYTLMAITNGNSNLAPIGLDHLFAEHFSAETSGAAKPDELMFKQALEAAGVTAQQAIHIGDHPLQDVAAAQRVGFKAIWFNLQQEIWQPNLARYQTAERPNEWAADAIPDAEFHQWQNLPNIVQQITAVSK